MLDSLLLQPVIRHDGRWCGKKGERGSGRGKGRAFELVSWRWMGEKVSSDEDEEKKARDGGLEEFMKQEPSQCKARCIHPSPGKMSERV